MLQSFLSICSAVLLAVSYSLAQDTIYINELLASNTAVLADEAGEFDDWIELYNTGKATVYIGGWYFRSGPSSVNSQKYILPQTAAAFMPAGGYLLIWADKDLAQGPLHVNFKLSREGEWVGLYQVDGSLVDSVSFGAQSPDVSLNRSPHGHPGFYLSMSPTPGQRNVLQYPLTVSPPQGLYSAGIEVALTAQTAGAQIHYTRDGSDVTFESALYTGPLTVESNTVIKAQAFIGETSISPIKISTYLIGESLALPVLLLVTPPGNLFDSRYGIYTNYENRGREWERPVHVSFLENREEKFVLSAGIRIHGGASRSLSKKNFRLYFRSEYGMSHLNYRVFADKPLDKFKRLVLYAPSHDQFTGSANPTLLCDVLIQSISRDLGGLYSAFRPAHLYLNGGYWGIYWLREYIDDHYIKDNLDIDEFDLNRTVGYSRSPVVREGNSAFWEETHAYMLNRDMAYGTEYQYVAENYINISNFIDYHVLGIFAATRDWPHNNVDRVHAYQGDGRWRWIMWDMNEAWHTQWPEHPTLEFCLRDQVMPSVDPGDSAVRVASTLFLRKLMKNDGFRQRFITRFADLMNTELSVDFLTVRLNGLIDVLAPDIEKDALRWYLPDLSQWEIGLNFVRWFIGQRHPHQYNDLNRRIGAGNPVQISLVQGEGGFVRLNTLELHQASWSGIYFDRTPVSLSAVPEAGYAFAGWGCDSLPDTTTLVHVFKQNCTLKPRFERLVVEEPMVINEINYHSSEDHDAGDWIELHNPSDEAVHMQGWHMTDSDSAHRFTVYPDVVVPAQGFFVFCRDSVRFQTHFPDCHCYIGNWTFGLSADKDDIYLFDMRGARVDFVSYSSEAPWPSAPNGTGSTLELIDAEKDNNDAMNWQASQGYGSPGLPNVPNTNVNTGNAGAESASPFYVFQNCPNPFRSNTTFRWELFKPAVIGLAVYNVQGRVVFTHSSAYSPGVHAMEWAGLDETGTRLPSGMYVAVFTSGTERRSIKTLLFR